MNGIQVDAFEVQLGAGMLLQFGVVNGDPITILADAGVHASGYQPEHVRDKLPEAMDRFSEGNRRIDLIVGTHYDADHLKGLPPVIRDDTLEIGEIWLPPVADDQAPNPLAVPVDGSQLLALKWLDEESLVPRSEYFRAHLEQCRKLRNLEAEALRFAGRAEGLGWRPGERLGRLAAEPGAFTGDVSLESLSGMGTWFESQLAECSGLPGDERCGCHADVVYDDSMDSGSVDGLGAMPYLFGASPPEGARHRVWTSQPELAAAHGLSFALLRRAVAANAITAIHLAQVVEAIRERRSGGRTVEVRCPIIPAGRPVKLKWEPGTKRFLEGAAARPGCPVITLLGPSDRLVEKHRDRLPVGVSADLAMASAIPIESITPSNQLSFIFKIGHLGQNLLVTGDAGCVDYKESPRGPYYPRLLEEFDSLQVVQVAHHAGHNAHFYRVLLESGFASQDSEAYLLLSHAKDDRHRPSEAFARFVGGISWREDLKLLFTSRPLPGRIAGFGDLIHPRVGRAAPVGDVRLCFDGSGWQVETHAVEV